MQLYMRAKTLHFQQLDPRTNTTSAALPGAMLLAWLKKKHQSRPPFGETGKVAQILTTLCDTVSPASEGQAFPPVADTRGVRPPTPVPAEWRRCTDSPEAQIWIRLALSGGCEAWIRRPRDISARYDMTFAALGVICCTA